MDKYKDIKKIIENEIIWCEEHRGMKGEVYEEAFIAGLKQVLFFINSSKPAKLPKPIEMKQRKVFIVAEDFNRARNFAIKWESYISRNWTYVEHQDKLRGLRDIVIYILGGWSHNPNFEGISQQIEVLKVHDRVEIRYEQDLQKEQIRESISG
jgi:hypothetical protein